ncbi:low affinity potassium transporter [Arachnomyces sp. PD_36]|nr:low affinity potassium transporter [Arachnomyces sp. PD_36]
MAPEGNIAGIDAFFFAVTSSTTTGLATADLKVLPMYQQLVVYFIPLLANLQVINTAVVFVRLHWFEKRFKDIVRLSRQPSKSRQTNMMSNIKVDNHDKGGPGVLEQGNSDMKNAVPPTVSGLHRDPNYEMAAQTTQSSGDPTLAGTGTPASNGTNAKERDPLIRLGTSSSVAGKGPETPELSKKTTQENVAAEDKETGQTPQKSGPGHITFAAQTHPAPSSNRALRVPGPRDFERGYNVYEVGDDDAGDDDLIKSISFEEPPAAGPSGSRLGRTLSSTGRILSHATSVERAATAASNAFIMGGLSRRRSNSKTRPSSKSSSKANPPPMPYLSYTPTLGRNSQFLDLTEEQREELGGIEYRSLKLLSKITTGVYFFFHIFGPICLVGWIYNTSRVHQDYLDSIGENNTWWAFYSGMTTFNNLGLTVTPDSMISYQKESFPVFIMTFLMYIGNTLYPCMLRFVIWTFFKLVPKDSSLKEPLNFLLDHPRRCYTLLFGRGPTWMLFGIHVVLNLVDIILILSLDVHNEEMAGLTFRQRILPSMFQAAAARTTGATIFNVAKVHPAVQLSLMVMMYISVFPIAMSVRRTNIYEESSLGIYGTAVQEEIDETKSESYIGTHLKKQLAFDLWYIILGIFIITIAEGSRIANVDEPAFETFEIFFEVVSA